MAEACPFCDMGRDRIIHEDPFCYVVRDGFPVSDGHSLIISKRHISSFFETTGEEQNALLGALQQTKSELDKQYSPDAYNIGINDGMDAGQTIPHLHIHLIPRYQGDTADPRGGVRWVISDKAAWWSGHG